MMGLNADTAPRVCYFVVSDRAPRHAHVVMTQTTNEHEETVLEWRDHDREYDWHEICGLYSNTQRWLDRSRVARGGREFYLWVEIPE